MKILRNSVLKMNEFGVGVCSGDELLVLLPKELLTELVLSLQLQKK